MARGVRIYSFFIVGLFLLVSGSIPPLLWAAPSVSSVSGTISNGGIITITGSGFGTTGPNIILFDDFDNTSRGASNGVAINLTEPKVGKWDSRGDTGGGPIQGSTYSNAYARSGSLSWQTDWYYPAGGEDGPSASLYVYPNTTEIYVSWWIFIPTNYVFPGMSKGSMNWKIQWLYKTGHSCWSYDDIWSDYYAAEWAWDIGAGINCNRSGRVYSTEKYTPTLTRNQWSRWEYYVKGSTGSDGKVVMTETNATHPRFESLNLTGKTMDESSAWNKFGLSVFGRGGVADHNSVFYQDDVYISVGSGARARVEIGNNATYSKCTNLGISTATSWSDTSVTATVRQGSFPNGSSAYLFVIDANGTVNSQGYPIVIGGGSSDAAPAINITSPTSESNYVSSESTVEIAGSASDDKGVSSVTWSNSRGGSGNAVNNSGTWSNWSTGNISLLEGENIITVTAIDTAQQSTTDTLTVTYSTSGAVQAWSALAQTGDSGWGNSYVTYCARLLVEGSSVTASGSQIQLGFQGRASGSYTIKKVSIAERDTGGLEGDVVDSTWTKVTFNGNSVSTWATDVITVPAGQEKLSNVIPFVFHAGKDYYVTFKIESPSVYLDPPSTYRELYFSSADHTGDIDWGQNGHDSILDYHALSGIYVVAGVPVGPAPPPNFRISNR
jgi:hypothetical protein